jgi:hypothetical protein
VREVRNAYKILVKPDGKRSLGRPKCRQAANMDFKEIGFESVDWFELAKDRGQWQALLNTVLDFRVP